MYAGMLAGIKIYRSTANASWRFFVMASVFCDGYCLESFSPNREKLSRPPPLYRLSVDKVVKLKSLPSSSRCSSRERIITLIRQSFCPQIQTIALP